jgi:hypothetical protein
MGVSHRTTNPTSPIHQPNFTKPTSPNHQTNNTIHYANTSLMPHSIPLNHQPCLIFPVHQYLTWYLLLLSLTLLQYFIFLIDIEPSVPVCSIIFIHYPNPVFTLFTRSPAIKLLGIVCRWAIGNCLVNHLFHLDPHKYSFHRSPGLILSDNCSLLSDISFPYFMDLCSPFFTKSPMIVSSPDHQAYNISLMCLK